MSTTRTVITEYGSTSTRTLTRASDITGVGDIPRHWEGLGQPSRIFRIWVNRLRNADIMDRGLIRQFCTTILPLAAGYESHGWNTNLTIGEAGTLVDLFAREVYMGDRDGYRLADEHEEFGREWLRLNWSQLWKAFNPPDDLIDVGQVLRADTFRWVDVREVQWGTYYRPPSFVPVYATRYVGFDGEIRTFHYHWSAWQSGGGR